MRRGRSVLKNALFIKFKESLSAVVPIIIIVLLLHISIVPMPGGTLGMFLVGAVMLIVGMSLFTLGADIAMMPMGEQIGGYLTRTRKIVLLTVVCFVMGVTITIAEPDLQVLAEQLPSVPSNVLIGTVAIGVGVFLVIAILRIIFQKKLNYMLIVFYVILFIIAAFTPRDFLPVAFDSGGVTTGPITVPFILALGIGVAAVRGGKSSQDDSFGLVALSSIGPIVTVLILGMVFPSQGNDYAPAAVTYAESFPHLMQLFAHGIPHYAKEVLLALSPIVFFFIIAQIFFLKLPARQMIRIGAGLVYSYAGLVLFLTGVNVGFLPAGTYLGESIGALSYNWILIPLGMVMGFFIVAAEPAVHVLNSQVESITDGAISKNTMLISLSVGVAVSIALAMIRVLTGISIWFLILPGYAIALGLSFFVPNIFTAIAFDSGGVASGPMTATFLLPFTMGACRSIGGNILTDAFGVVAMVAMTPLIAIQIMGLIYTLRTRHLKKDTAPPDTSADETEIIELLEEE